ncbi:UNVERIFIED_CONTAM: hypothetical protein Sradi_5771600 [Sesamum radiatum]|uniref:Uncharacterized protein n=1 Tax=Sesamum radiatum TaxID=300843 RepID=A0AAW2KP60_SESRA
MYVYLQVGDSSRRGRRHPPNVAVAIDLGGDGWVTAADELAVATNLRGDRQRHPTVGDGSRRACRRHQSTGRQATSPVTALDLARRHDPMPSRPKREAVEAERRRRRLGLEWRWMQGVGETIRGQFCNLKRVTAKNE